MLPDRSGDLLRRKRIKESVMNDALKNGLHSVTALLDHEDADRRFAAVWCLGRGVYFQGGREIASGQIQHLLELYKREPETSVRNEIIFALPEIGHYQIMYDFIREARSDSKMFEAFKESMGEYFHNIYGLSLVEGCRERLSQPQFNYKRVLYLFWLGECADDEDTLLIVKGYLSDAEPRVQDVARLAAASIQRRITPAIPHPGEGNAEIIRG
jgi:hypothetical protein